MSITPAELQEKKLQDARYLINAVWGCRRHLPDFDTDLRIAKQAVPFIELQTAPPVLGCDNVYKVTFHNLLEAAMLLATAKP